LLQTITVCENNNSGYTNSHVDRTFEKSLFTQIIFNDWNRLSSYMEAPFINAFKNRLDDFLQDKKHDEKCIYEFTNNK